jgi:starch synthase
VIHGHDTQATLALIYRQHDGGGADLKLRAKTLLTIHNLAYQGIFPSEAMKLLGLPKTMGVFPGLLEFHGRLNLLKAGILVADMVTTVSPTYAREVVSEPNLGCGLEGVLEQKGIRFRGVLNGVDSETWDPTRDPYLPATYGTDDLSGKVRCRAQLLQEIGLQATGGPLIGMVGRLVEQKGLDLVLAGIDRLVEAGFTLVVLGTGEARYEKGLTGASRRHPGRVGFLHTFDDALAHRILAGSDIFLMPSRFEPCGLTQLYALRYGTVPVVRNTGGLADTVVDATLAGGTGFLFNEYKTKPMLAALVRARRAWNDLVLWTELVQRGMGCNFSWEAAASSYEEIYAQMANLGGRP